jgi:hypothetical protein
VQAVGFAPCITVIAENIRVSFLRRKNEAIRRPDRVLKNGLTCVGYDNV